MKVLEAMIRGAFVADVSDSVRQAARMMAEDDLGFLPVIDDDQIVGVITDRDIVTRCVALGLSASSRVGAMMTPRIRCCYEDQDLDLVIEDMAERQLRRMPVLNRANRLVGILSLADAARIYSPDAVGIAYSGVVCPSSEQQLRLI
ncbi:MAG TPA: CBS domain-containing protein [Rhizomicrobium sp.]|nr:CBS domain-containing protein [Rhizomicrobium sp.]